MDDVKWPKNDLQKAGVNFYPNSVTNTQNFPFAISDSSNKSNQHVKNNKISFVHSNDSQHENDIQEKFATAGLDKQAKIQQIVESSISESARQQIHHILDLVSALSSTEKLLLYLRLPTDSVSTVTDPLRQPLNPLGSRTEISQTIMWIRTHLEEDPELSLPKQDVYEEYTNYCVCNNMKALSTADFGKVMKQVYPRVRPRRLGTRGNSRYCYAGLRKRIKLEPPMLPDLGDYPKSTEPPCSQADLTTAASCLIREWAEKLLGVQFPTLLSLASHILDKMCVDTRSVAALTVLNATRCSADAEATPSLSSIGNLSMSTKHRETQLQLQRKLQQREIIREQKRKLQLQVNKGETKQQRTKKVKLQTSHTSEEDEETVENELSAVTPPTGSQKIPQGNKINHSQQTNNVCDSKQNKTMAVTSTTNSFHADDGSGAPPDTTEVQNDVRCLNKNATKHITVKSFANLTYSQSDRSYSDDKSFESGKLKCTKQTPDPKIPKLNSEKACKVSKIVTLKKTKQTDVSNEFKSNSTPDTVKKILKSPEYNKNPQEMFADNVSDISTNQMHKIAIPRLPNSNKQKTLCPNANIIILPPNAATAILSPRQMKYKAIQPKPTEDGNSAHNNVDVNTRSQDKTVKNETATDKKICNRTAKNLKKGPEIFKKHSKLTTDIEKPLQADSENSENQDTEKFKKDELSTMDYRQPSSDINVLPLPSLVPIGSVQSDLSALHRERVISIGNIDKDALDDYLYGGSNSQEPEEEIMQYFQNDSSESLDSDMKQVNQNLLCNPIEDSNVSNKNVCDSSTEKATSNLTDVNVSILTNDEVHEKTDKLSQLRLLLEQNLGPGKLDKCNDVRNANVGLNPAEGSAFLKTSIDPLNEPAVTSTLTNYLRHRQQTHGPLKQNLILPSLLTNLNPRRRVSFDTQSSESVPPSPNTRRKNFSFTPISPGPHSPCGGKHSKCSSSNASPFVSPRNTPIPRNRIIGNLNVKKNCVPNVPITVESLDMAQNEKIVEQSIKIEDSQSGDSYGKNQFIMPVEQTAVRNFPMSAPPSPMLPYRQKCQTQTNYLKTLLDSNNKIAFTSNYAVSNEKSVNQIQKRDALKLKIDTDIKNDFMCNAQNVLCDFKPEHTSGSSQAVTPNSADPLSQEVSQFFSDNIQNYDALSNSDNGYRSRSVPPHRLKYIGNQLVSVSRQQELNLGFLQNPVASACSSIGQTPIPNEFCDFNNSFSDNNILNSENLNKIFNIIDSSVPNDATEPTNENLNLISAPQGTSFIPDGAQNVPSYITGPIRVNSDLITGPGSIVDINKTGICDNTSDSYRNIQDLNIAVNSDITNEIGENVNMAGFGMTLESATNNMADNINLHLSNNMADMNANMTDISTNITINSIPDNGKNVNLTGMMPIMNHPSRSVPNTPLPVAQKGQRFSFTSQRDVVVPNLNSSRSYPSTPSINEFNFTYGTVSDYLINGQPVVPKIASKPFVNHIQEKGLEEFSLPQDKNQIATGFVEEGEFSFNEMNSEMLMDTNDTFSFDKEADTNEQLNFNNKLIGDINFNEMAANANKDIKIEQFANITGNGGEFDLNPVMK